MHATRSSLWLALGLVCALILSVMTPARADAYSSSPCPNWSLQAVLDDPTGDWDGDRAENADEIYVAGGLNPCVHDASNFCSLNPGSCRQPRTRPTGVYYTYTYVPIYVICSNGYWNWTAVNASPNTDWDNDGVTNYVEAHNGANPCAAPCPVAYAIDVALNPWADWDGDGRTNSAEYNAGTNPCSRTYVYVPTAPQPTTPQRLPHVGGPSATTSTVHVAPTPTPNPCPPGYPYFHADNGQCYANPVGPPTGW